jgi:hypothetical protein
MGRRWRGHSKEASSHDVSLLASLDLSVQALLGMEAAEEAAPGSEHGHSGKLVSGTAHSVAMSAGRVQACQRERGAFQREEVSYGEDSVELRAVTTWRAKCRYMHACSTPYSLCVTCAFLRCECNTNVSREIEEHGENTAAAITKRSFNATAPTR